MNAGGHGKCTGLNERLDHIVAVFQGTALAKKIPHCGRPEVTGDKGFDVTYTARNGEVTHLVVSGDGSFHLSKSCIGTPAEGVQLCTRKPFHTSGSVSPAKVQMARERLLQGKK